MVIEINWDNFTNIAKFNEILVEIKSSRKILFVTLCLVYARNRLNSFHENWTTAS